MKEKENIVNNGGRGYTKRKQGTDSDTLVTETDNKNDDIETLDLVTDRMSSRSYGRTTYFINY